MNLIETNEPGEQATVERRRAADRWQRKGDFWSRLTMIASVPMGALLLVQFAVKDDLWSAVITVLGALVLAGQIACGVRMGVCSGRARQLRKGGAR